MPAPVDIVASAEGLARVVERASGAPMIALDVEGNGLFAYRARLCTAQLAWERDGELEIAIVDTLAVDPAPLARLLGPNGPVKVLHDFTFDLRLLFEAGILLANLRDTSVLARLLGRKATGLASLLSSELGITAAKELQQHDWSRRPLREVELDYLATDVRYSIALYEKLSADARAIDIEDEVATECAFKHESALAPPRERRPAYLRVKGSEALDAPGLAVLRRLVEERERIAQRWDQPPFKVAGNELLLVLAERKPRTFDELRQLRRGLSPRLLGVGQALVSAVLAGLEDGAVPAADRGEIARMDRAVVATRRAREKRLSAWRRTEAAARGVDEQVVLPGHCLAELVALEDTHVDAIARVPGLGARRFERYAAALAGLLAGERTAPARVAEPEPSG